MGKRFIDTDLYDHPWYRMLPPRLKCAWDWLFLRCDEIGLCRVDVEKMSFEIGETVTFEELLTHFKIQEISHDLVWLPSFVAFQFGNSKGELSKKSGHHRRIAQKLIDRGFPEPTWRVEEPEDKKKIKPKKPRKGGSRVGGGVGAGGVEEEEEEVEVKKGVQGETPNEADPNQLEFPGMEPQPPPEVPTKKKAGHGKSAVEIMESKKRRYTARSGSGKAKGLTPAKDVIPKIISQEER